MPIHMATAHSVNPCLDASGNRVSRNNASASSSSAFQPPSVAVPSSRVGIDASDEDAMIQAAIAASMQSVQGGVDEDEALARALMESQQGSTGPLASGPSAQATSMNPGVTVSTGVPVAASGDSRCSPTDRALEHAIAASLGMDTNLQAAEASPVTTTATLTSQVNPFSTSSQVAADAEMAQAVADSLNDSVSAGHRGTDLAAPSTVPSQDEDPEVARAIAASLESAEAAEARREREFEAQLEAAYAISRTEYTVARNPSSDMDLDDWTE